ncbi:MAG: tRNA (adenosine(37)-N6)-dimethylallyltransferase MiaA [Crocinitomicaceae bacterium]
MDELIVILGPTASGKTKLACHLAQLVGGEIISADSRQVYRRMNIGTGKDLTEYTINNDLIPYHLIDIRDPGYKYSIWEYQDDFISAFNDIVSRGKIPILCGGSGLYIETALKGNSFTGIETNTDLRNELAELTNSEILSRWEEVDESLKEKLDRNTIQRAIRAIEIDVFMKEHPNWIEPVYPKINYTIFGIDIERERRRERITQRLSDRLNTGLIEEVESLVDEGVTYDSLSAYGLEYKWVGDFLQKKISKKELFEGLNTAIHQFSKRQMTWFRRMQKQGYHIVWVNESEALNDKLNHIFTTIDQKSNNRK